MNGIVIIGAGECGVRAAFALREKGYRGAITLIGEERTLPYERPPLSKGVAVTPKLIRSEASYADAEIKCMFGVSADRIDVDARSIRLADGTTSPYDKLLLATGARPRLFHGMEGCATLRSDLDAAAIHSAMRPHAKIGMIGGGFIGLELAAAARKVNADVTVFEAGPRILNRAVPQEIARIVRERHVAEGVNIVTNANVSRADRQTVELSAESAFTFDAVIAGVGAVPNAELAEGAGLAVNNGIIVNAAFLTSDPNIYAAGDCCNFEWHGRRLRLESWKAAQDQGAHVAAAILGMSEPYTKVPWFWSDQYNLTLQVAGIFDQTRPVQTRAIGDETGIVFQCDDMGLLTAVAGIGPDNAVSKDLRILEKLIERHAVVDPHMLADPSQNLKRLLKAA